MTNKPLGSLQIAVALTLSTTLLWYCAAQEPVAPVLVASKAPDVKRDALPGPALPVTHSSFMSPHASPIVVHGKHVFVTNTPADTVDVIDTATRKVVARIPVGVDPVGLAIRPDGKELWAANHVSDSVSVIDTDSSSPTYLQVIATVQEYDSKTKATRFDEPVGIAFASNEKAYVALSSENAIAVINVGTRKVTKRLEITAQDPRAIRVRGDRLYVTPFESNNKTQLSGGAGDKIDGDLVTFDAWDHSIKNNNVLSIGHVVDIIKHPRVPDRDLYIFDTKTDRQIKVVDTLGTLLYGMAVDSKGRVFIAQTDARNDANGRSGTKKHGLKELENRAFLNQVTSLTFKNGDPEKPTFIDLEPLPPKHPAEGMALATPFAIEITPDDSTLVVSAAGSDKIFTVDVKSGTILARANVGAVPRGIALATSADGKQTHAWVLNAVANTVSLVDISNPAKLAPVATVALEDPTDPQVKAGRIAFNTAAASTTGTFSCASCHPDGHTDQLLWVLKTPIVTGGDQIMPRSTMPIRGLRDTEPYHWDGIPGDPYGGNNSANVRRRVKPNSDIKDVTSAPRNLIDAGLASTMKLETDATKNDEGKAGKLSASERDAMSKFLLSVTYPPAQRRPYTNVITSRARDGFELFHVKGDLDKKPKPNVCGNCHRMPFLVSTNTPGTGMEAPTWRGAYDRWLILPQGRLNIIDFDFYRRIAEQGAPERNVWRMSWGSRRRFDPIWDMVLESSTGFSGSFARQVTIHPSVLEDPLTSDLLAALETSAHEGSVVLQGEGTFIDGDQVERRTLQFDPNYNEGSYVETSGTRQAYTRSQLFALATKRRFVGTFTAGLGSAVDLEHPQPALWTLGALHSQRGRQKFPVLRDGKTSLTMSGRHIEQGATLFVDGRRTDGTVEIDQGTVTVKLSNLPGPGMRLLQVQNPGGLFSNDFIFYVVSSQTAANSGPLGTWQLAVESKSRPDRDHQYTIRISREGDKLVGFYRESDSRQFKIPTVILKDKTLSFEVPRDDLIMAYKGTLAADSITGTMEYRRANRTRSSRQFSATREQLNPTGTWRLLVESKSRPERDHEYTIRLAREEGKLVGFYAGSDRKETKVPQLTMAGSRISFSVPQEERTLAYQGTITDDFISGTMEYQFPDRDSRNRTFTGTREKR
jgi:YVTN family beta-propeller protein